MQQFDLDSYRQAKELIPHLRLLVQRLEQIEAELSIYNNFFAINNISRCIRDNKTILEIHLNQQIKVLESKGVV